MRKSISVIGFKPPDEKWKLMKSVWDACLLAKVEVPIEVYNFFDKNPPDQNGVEVEVISTEWDDGFEIAIEDIPKDVKIIRVIYL